MDDFNPNFDFETRAQQIKQRKLLLAQSMRQQMEEQNAPAGQMVSGYYVPQSLPEMISPVIRARQNQAEAERLAQEEAAYNSDDIRAGQEHAASRPRGPQFDGSGPFKEPTTQDQIEYAQKGLAIPSRREVMERLLNDQEVNAPVREEARTQANLNREDAQAARASEHRASLEQRAEEMRQRAEDARASREDRAAARSEERALRLALAQMAADGRTNTANNKPVPHAISKELAEAESNAATLNQLNTTFEDKFSGPIAKAKNTIAPYDPTGSIDDSGAQWWKNYKKQASLIERHSLFGASLTTNEQAAWAAADINDGMSPATIKKNLATREAIAKKVFANGVDRYAKGGYPQVLNVFDAGAPRSTGGASSTWDKPTPSKGGTVKWGDLR